MPQCPNCSYKLVLLLHRPKYKCALCSKLYPKKEIDTKQFKKFNKRQRIFDIENYEKERKQEITKIGEIRRQIKKLFNGLPKSPKEYKKEYYEKNKKNIKQRNKKWRINNLEYDENRKRKYYQKNREKILLKSKIKRQTNPELYGQKRREWRNKNIEITRVCNIIRTYRRKQKALALHYLENEGYKASTANIFPSVSTYTLSYLLFE